MSDNVISHHQSYVSSLEKGLLSEAVKILQQSSYSGNLVSINAADSKGRTLLHLGVGQGDTALVKKAIHLGADVRLLDAQGYSAAKLAVDRGDVKMTTFLLESGSDIRHLSGDTDRFAHMKPEEIAKTLVDEHKSAASGVPGRNTPKPFRI